MNEVRVLSSCSRYGDLVWRLESDVVFPLRFQDHRVVKQMGPLMRDLASWHLLVGKYWFYTYAKPQSWLLNIWKNIAGLFPYSFSSLPSWFPMKYDLAFLFVHSVLKGIPFPPSLLLLWRMQYAGRRGKPMVIACRPKELLWRRGMHCHAPVFHSLL